LSKKAEEREEPNEKGKLMELVFFYRRDSAASGQPTTACELYSGTVQPYIQWYSGDSTVSHQKKKTNKTFANLKHNILTKSAFIFKCFGEHRNTHLLSFHKWAGTNCDNRGPSHQLHELEPVRAQ